MENIAPGQVHEEPGQGSAGVVVHTAVCRPGGISEILYWLAYAAIGSFDYGPVPLTNLATRILGGGAIEGDDVQRLNVVRIFSGDGNGTFVIDPTSKEVDSPG